MVRDSAESVFPPRYSFVFPANNVLTSRADFTLRIPKPGWRNASTPTSILTEWGDEEGGIMGTFSFLHNIHCLVGYIASHWDSKEPKRLTLGNREPFDNTCCRMRTPRLRKSTSRDPTLLFLHTLVSFQIHRIRVTQPDAHHRLFRSLH